MKNLAGNKDADKFIQEELYLAGIPEIKIGWKIGLEPNNRLFKIRRRGIHLD